MTQLTDSPPWVVLGDLENDRTQELAISHTASWIIGSLTTSSIVVSGLFIYSLSDGAPSDPYGRVSNFSIIPDVWVCRKNTNIRGHEYTYAVNLRNGATGPARLACEGVKPISVSPMDARARMGPNGKRPPMMRVDPDAK